MQKTIFGYSEEEVRRQLTLCRNTEERVLPACSAVPEFSWDKVISNAQRVLDNSHHRNLVKKSLLSIKIPDEIKSQKVSEQQGIIDQDRKNRILKSPVEKRKYGDRKG